MFRKKIFIATILLSIAMLSAGANAAENIVIEGETPSGGNKYSTEANGSASSGKYLAVQYSALNKESFWVSYDVNCEEAGWYDLVLESTRPSYEFCSDFKVSVNGGKEILASRYADETESSYWKAVHMGRLNMGGVYLEKGKNTIKILVDERVRSDNASVQVCFYLDTIELIPSESYLARIEAGAQNGIFEESDSIFFKAIMNAPGKTDTAISYKITDYTGSVKEQGNVSVPAGEKEKSFEVELGVGWYKAEFSYDGKTESKNFCVVHKASDRKLIENSPFALDVAANWEVMSYADKMDFARAARLLGVGWVRDRFDWKNMYKSGTAYKFYPWNEDSINIFSEEGLKILEVFHSNPADYAASGDLRDVYAGTKAAAVNYKGKVQAWEVWNEPDISFWSDSAEEYGSYFKAAAIGLADSGADVLKLNAGMAESAVTKDDSCSFFELALRNRIMDYSDIFAYHVYGYSDTDSDYTGLSGRTDANEAAHKAYASNKPMWVSEGGYGMWSQNSKLSQSEQLVAGRAAIRALSDSISAGNDMHFWFILGQRQESTGRHFGMLDNNNEPELAYSVYSNLTYQLGEAKYKGELVTSSESVHGALFNNGKNDVAVMWAEADGANHTFINAEYVRVCDMVGNESVLRGTNGSVTVELSKNPVYVIFEDGCSERNYYREEETRVKATAGEIPEANKVVIRQTSASSDKAKGHKIGAEGTEITAEIYNFSKKDVSGIISATADDGFSVTGAGNEILIPSGGKETVKLTVTYTEPATTQKGYLTIEFDGVSATRSVSRLYADPNAISVSQLTAISGWTADKLNTNNIVRGGSATAQNTASGVKFNATFSGGDKWFYPTYTLSDSEKESVRSMTGICFDFTTEMKSGSINLLLAGSLMNPISIESGTKRIYIPFSELSGDVMVAEISTMGLGINSGTNSASYTIENLSFYKDASTTKNEQITISGITSGAFYEKNIPSANVTFPSSAKTKEVFLNGEKLSGDIGSIQLDGLETGKYELFATAELSDSRVLRSSVSFYVQKNAAETEFLFRREAEKPDFGSITKTAGEAFSGGYLAEVSTDKKSAELSYTVCVPADGRYRVKCCAPEGANNSEMKFSVNGNAVETEFDGNDTYTAACTMVAGENKITLKITDTENCKFSADYIEIERFKYSESRYVKMEGEDYTAGSSVMKLTSSWNAQTLDFSKLSGQNGLKLEGAKGTSPYASYSINVPEAGNYKLSFTSTPLNKKSSYCQISLTIGSSTISLTSSNCTRADNSEVNCDAVMYNYNYSGTVRLEKGMNTIVIKPTSGRTIKNDYYLLLDAMEFTSADNVANEAWVSRNYLNIDETAQLYIRKNSAENAVSMKSADSGIVNVDSVGKISAVSAGATVITVKVGEDTFEIPITVYEGSAAPLGFVGGNFKIGSFGDSTFTAAAASYSEDEKQLLETVVKADANTEKGEIFEIKLQENPSYAKGFLWNSMTEARPLFPTVKNTAYAKLEGEDYQAGSSIMKLTSSWNASTLDFSKLSGKNGLKLEGAKDTSPYATYEIYAPKAGEYNVNFVSTPLDNTLNYCNVNIVADEVSYSLSSQTAERINEEEIPSDAVMYNYKLKESIYLKEGVNEIKLTPVSGRDWDGAYYFLLDFIEFTYAN